MNIFKNVFLFFAFSAAVFMAAAQSSTLVKIVNDSSASISATLGKDSIKIGARKSARCLATFPFHTIDLFNFVLDRAQIPSDAYVIETETPFFGAASTGSVLPLVHGGGLGHGRRVQRMQRSG